MVVIAQNSRLNSYTEIVTYSVTAQLQRAVFDVLVQEANQWMRLQPGFLSANCYQSEDGTRVVHAVQMW